MGLFPDAGRSPGGAHWRTLGEEFRAHGAWRPSLLAFASTSLGTRPRVGTLTGQQVGRRLPPGAIVSERCARSFRKAGRNHFGRVGAIISECRATSPGICKAMSNARGVLKRTKNVRAKTIAAALTIGAYRAEIEHYCDLGDGVIDQSRRRVLEGEQVPDAEKLYSIFEPHTDLIKRGKVRTPLEFGHKVFLAESAKGLITQYEVLDGNPSDE